MAGYSPGKRDQNVDARVARIAERQHGLITATQAAAAGCTPDAIRGRVANGRWERLRPGVYRIGGTAAGWRQTTLAACLWLGDGALASHATAAALWLGGKPSGLHVTAPPSRHRGRDSLVRIHHSRTPVPRDQRTAVDAIPVTAPPRTLLDLSAIWPCDRLEDTLDEMLRRGTVTLAGLKRTLGADRRGHTGAALLRQFIDERARGGVTESHLETLMLRTLERAGLPRPVLQHVVRDHGRFVARLDFAYPDAKVGVETDGHAHHEGRRAFDRDRARGNELQRLGWTVIRVTWTHLRQDPDAVVAWVAAALAGRVDAVPANGT